MKKTYIYPTVRVTEADVEAILAAGSFIDTVSDEYEVGDKSENGTWVISSKRNFYDDFDEEEEEEY